MSAFDDVYVARSVATDCSVGCLLIAAPFGCGRHPDRIGANFAKLPELLSRHQA